MERIREAIELCLEVYGETSEPLDFVGVQRVSIAAWQPFIVPTLRVLMQPVTLQRRV